MVAFSICFGGCVLFKKCFHIYNPPVCTTLPQLTLRKKPNALSNFECSGCICYSTVVQQIIFSVQYCKQLKDHPRVHK